MYEKKYLVLYLYLQVICVTLKSWKVYSEIKNKMFCFFLNKKVETFPPLQVWGWEPFWVGTFLHILHKYLGGGFVLILNIIVQTCIHFFEGYH